MEIGGMNKANYLTIALSILVAIFLAQNFSSVSLKFLFWEMEMPRIILMAVTFAAGYMVGISMKLNDRSADRP